MNSEAAHPAGNTSSYILFISSARVCPSLSTFDSQLFQSTEEISLTSRCHTSGSTATPSLPLPSSPCPPHVLPAQLLLSPHPAPFPRHFHLPWWSQATGPTWWAQSTCWSIGQVFWVSEAKMSTSASLFQLRYRNDSMLSILAEPPETGSIYRRQIENEHDFQPRRYSQPLIMKTACTCNLSLQSMEMVTCQNIYIIFYESEPDCFSSCYG